MADGSPDEMRTVVREARARLPGLNIDIVHRRLTEDDAEQISINLTAAPSFEAFGRALDAANPFALWARGAQLTWLAWLELTRALALPLPLMPPSLPAQKPDAASHCEQERDRPD